MHLLTVSTANAIFHVIVLAQYVAYLLHKYFTKSAKDYFKLYDIESHEYDKHIEYLF